MSDLYCVVGNPVEHSRSPHIHGRFAELAGQSIAYSRHLAALGGFEAALQQLLAAKFSGCNVTVPFKFDAFSAAHTTSARAELAQAANTLVFDYSGASPAIHADNTDGAGLVWDITVNAGAPLADKRVLLLGAGGAAAGVLGPLLLAGPSQLMLVNRTLSAAQALVERHRQHPSLASVLHKSELQWQDLPGLAAYLAKNPAGFDVVINATAASLSGATLALPPAIFKPGALAYDMMYGPSAQGFLQWAASCGAVPRDGLGMLVGQAGEAFALWRGVHPPAAQVLTELRQAVQ